MGETPDDDKDHLDKIIEYETKLEKLILSQNRMLALKTYLLFTFGIISVVIMMEVIFPLINYAVYSTKESTVLKQSLISNKIVPENMSIQDVASDDLFITAWDLNNRSPRYFSKWSQENLQETDFNHNMSLDNMVWASASTPLYFKPAVIDDNVYISGDNLAMSPAMFAYYYANEKKNIGQKKIRVLSVGATNELADRIDSKASLLEWAVRLPTLNAPVKKHTQDYMTRYLLKQNGHELYKFEISSTRDWEENFYLTHDREPILQTKSQELVFRNKEDADFIIETIVDEKFGP